MSFIDNINQEIKKTIDDITVIANKALKESTPELVKKVFDTSTGNNGRSWEQNAPSTIKRKGSNKPNIETGTLEAALSQEGFILDDDYMEHLPYPPRTKDKVGYKYANDMRKFDDIGRTPTDEAFIEQQIEKRLQDEYK